MRLSISGLEVLFPYDSIYEEQLNYMKECKKLLDEGGHGLLEMPTGTGKTVALLSLILAFKETYHEKVGKCIYCTRTVPEMDQVMNELNVVVNYRNRMLSTTTDTTTTSTSSSSSKPQRSEGILGICLSSRRNMCIHEEVMKDNDLETVDSKCRERTAPWIRREAEERGEGGGLCDYFETLDRQGTIQLPSGIYDLDKLKRFGKTNRICPYFLTRTALAEADVIVYNYQYMLDPKVSSLVSSQLTHDSIVVFDEAHNIDNVCIEAFSITLNKRVLGAAAGNLTRLRRQVQRVRETDQQKLQDEYAKLVRGLNEDEDEDDATTTATKTRGVLDRRLVDRNEYVAAPVLPEDVLNEALPGNVRRAEHFLAFMTGILQFLRKTIDVENVTKTIPASFRNELLEFMSVPERKPLRFCFSRLGRLLRTLEITDVGEFTPLSLVADFATVLATYDEGFVVLMEPSPPHAPTLHDPLLQLVCTDSSLAIQPVLKKFRSVIVTSGTLSPIALYPNLLGMTEKLKVSASLQMSMPAGRSTIMCPIVVARGTDGNDMTTSFEKRNNPSIVRNYGDLLVNLVQVVPDGIVCFFTSYAYLEDTVSTWKDTGVLDEVLKYKLIFIETKDIVETTLALDNYRRSCDCGRGAVFLSVARGKVAEGVNFEHHYGRCVVMFGVPYQYTQSRVLGARLEFLESKYQVRRNDFLTFDAMRQTAQCMGRVVRSKRDYGVMIFADNRYARQDKWSKLPQYIRRELERHPEHRSLSTSVAVDVCGQFLRKMAQPVVAPVARTASRTTTTTMATASRKRPRDETSDV